MKRLIMFLVLIAFVAFSQECFANKFEDYKVTRRITHKAKTYGHKNFTIDIDYTYENERIYADNSGIETHEVYNTFSYGLLHNLDIMVAIPFESKIYTNEENYAGMDDMNLGAKWMFYSKDDLQLSFFSLFTLPTGNYKQGDGRGRATYAFSLIASKDIGPLTINASGTYKYNDNINKQRFNIWKTSIGPEVKLTDAVSLIGNVELKNDKTKANLKTLVVLTGGFEWKVHEILTITPTFEAELNEGETDLTYGIGTTWNF